MQPASPLESRCGVEKLQQRQTSEASGQTAAPTRTPTQASTQPPTTSTRQAERLSEKGAVSLGGIIAPAVAAML